MLVNRCDSWTEQDDLVLAELVLRNIREGGTQTKAFQEAADKLNRTDAACAFRWNSGLKQNYESALEIAKKQRLLVKKGFKPTMIVEDKKEVKKEVKKLESQKKETVQKQLPKVEVSKETRKLQNGSVIEALKTLTDFVKENSQVKAEASNEIMAENQRLKMLVEKLEKEKKELEEEFQSFASIVKRASEMVNENKFNNSYNKMSS